MRARRVWASVAGAVLLVGGVSLVAAPAASANQSLNVNCFVDNSGEWRVTPGETLTVTFADWIQCTSIGFPGSPDFYTFDPNPFPPNVTITLDADLVDGTYPGLTITHRDGVTRSVITFRVGEPPAPPADTAVPAPIPAWVQAYGRASADATCVEGWNPSWDLWPNGGIGGFVCQRSIPSLG